jgi:uncharacterized membrane protein
MLNMIYKPILITPVLVTTVFLMAVPAAFAEVPVNSGNGIQQESVNEISGYNEG